MISRRAGCMAELLALGFGYSVTPLAARLITEGWQVTGTTRTPEKAAVLQKQGVTPHLWDGVSSLPRNIVQQADVIVISVPPGEAGCPAANAIGQVRADTVLLYLSSSGVYGDHGGAWVDEETACQPTSQRGENRLRAEGQWRECAQQASARLHLCRLAGIYGPGRNAIESLRGGTKGAKAGVARRIIKPGQVFNRIHRDDIARGLHALIDAGRAPGLLNFSDDEPAPPQDVITYAAGLLGIEPPPEIPFEEAEMSEMARSFYADNKRLRNARLKALPGFALQYPSYREGLAALLGL